MNQFIILFMVQCVLFFHPMKTQSLNQTNATANTTAVPTFNITAVPTFNTTSVPTANITANITANTSSPTTAVPTAPTTPLPTISPSASPTWSPLGVNETREPSPAPTYNGTTDVPTSKPATEDDTWMIVGIVFICLFVVAAIFAGYFAWQIYGNPDGKGQYSNANEVETGNLKNTVNNESD
eukprot:424110_1